MKNSIKFLFLLVFLSIGISIKSQCSSLSLYPTNNPISCLNGLATATVSCSNNTGPVTYTWLPAGGNGSVAIGLAPNSYTILAKDSSGCTGSTQLLILNNTGIQVVVSSINSGCTGTQITVNVINATPPYNYIWTPAAPNASVITTTLSGLFHVGITDGLGCVHSGTINIVGQIPVSGTVTSSALSCSGSLTSATITASGGVAPYTYSWSPIVSTNSIVSSISAGNYTVKVTDANNCTKDVTVAITSPAPLSNSLTLTNATCNSYSNGTASSNVTGGTPAYSYTWFPLNVHASSVGGLSAGNYTFVVKDFKGCSLTQTFSITQPSSITATMAHTDEFCINADGTATVTANGGNGSYTYTWTTLPVQTNSIATGLAAGIYTVNIGDIKNCKGQSIVTIGNISTMTVSISNKTDVTCNGSCNGTGTAGITGGSGPYSYNWLGVTGGTTQTISNLCPGQYTVKVTDALGCYATSSLSITEPPPMTYSISGTNIICNGNSTTLTGTVSGGTPGYTYNWQPGNLNGNSVVVSPAATTAYSLTVTDSKGCVGAIKVYSVIVNAPLSINAGANSLTVCPNVSTSITVNANGGDGNYSYVWQPGNLNTNNITVNVQSSTIYTVTIHDGCGSTPISSTVSVNVFAVTNPNFTVSATAGCEPFCVQFNNTTTGTTTALWTFGDFSPPVQSPVVTHCYTKAGVYSVMLTVTNMYGCKSSIIKPKLITVYGKPIADFTQKPSSITLNDNTGTFENSSVNASSFDWSLDGLHLSSDANLEHQFFEAKCYNLQLIARNGSACSDTTVREICVTDGFNFWAPNSFSPDNDGINDYFLPVGTGWIADSYSFEIMNRWGSIIFKSNEITTAWDGKVGGTPATDDIYNWKVFVKDIYGDEHEFTGHVLIMR